MKRVLVLSLAVLFLGSGCASGKYQIAPAGSLPPDPPEWDVRNSSFYDDLSRNYGKGAAYEHAKIRYLLGHIVTADYTFIRNGMPNNGDITSRHLRKKYRQRIEYIKTAEDFIERAGSKSEMSGKPYLVLAGDGLTYPAGDLLSHALDHVENEMDTIMAETGLHA